VARWRGAAGEHPDDDHRAGDDRVIERERHETTAERALEVLVTASQQSNPTLVGVAGRIVDTGVSPRIPRA
jgi:hypothetical protein